MESPPPFNKVDKLKITFKGYDLTSVFRPDGWRKYAILFIIISGLGWIYFGYDGCYDQFEMLGKTIPSLLFGTKTWTEVLTLTEGRYGIGTHFSAGIIYALLFYAISKYYEKIDIKGSLNLVFSISLTVFSISIFEFSWMSSYYWAQQQFWVLIPLTKQASILYQNLLFLTGGVFLILFVVGSPCKFRINKKLGFLILFSISIWTFWYFYPLSTPQLVVDANTERFWLSNSYTTVGWHNNLWFSFPNFPQTMYTIDLNPSDEKGVGVPFFVEDNIVHTVNTVMKIVWAYTFFYVGKVTLINKIRIGYQKNK
jgi:hypothetical protein